MPRHTHYADLPAYQTKDGSQIRELMHPNVHGNAKQSLAEATVGPGEQTELHCHGESEELYYIVEGSGEMQLGGERFAIGVGDTVCIDPGTPHAVRNTGAGPLRILCSCSPAYAHGDTELLGAAFTEE